MGQRLADEHSVEGVSVTGREGSEPEDGVFLQVKRLNPMLLPHGGDKYARWPRKRQLSEGMLHGNLPGHGASMPAGRKGNRGQARSRACKSFAVALRLEEAAWEPTLADDGTKCPQTQLGMIRHGHRNRRCRSPFLHDHVTARRRTVTKPFCSRILQTSRPDMTRNLSNSYLKPRDKHLGVEAILDLRRLSVVEKQLQSL